MSLVSSRENIFEHIPLVMPVMKVNLCRNVEKLAVTELKGVRRAAFILSTGMTHLLKWSKMLSKINHQGVNVKEFDEYFKNCNNTIEAGSTGRGY